mgnify:CR=1 FL=1
MRYMKNALHLHYCSPARMGKARKFCYYAVLLVTIAMALEGLAYVFVPTETLFQALGGYFYWTYVDIAAPNFLHRFPLLEWDLMMFEHQKIAFYTHITLGPLALVAGFFQLNPKLRKSNPKVHRSLGYVYFVSQLFSIPAGMWLGLHEYAGLAALYGFLGMGGSTLISSAMAFYYIKKRT